MWVEFVVGSRPSSKRFFSGFSGFPLSSKINISKFQFDLESEGHRFVSRNRLLSATLVKQFLFVYFIYLRSGHACASIHGSSWWRQDGDLQTAAEQVQPHQHDFPSGK